MLTTILGGILLLVVLTVIHELGHLLVARAFGVGVERFAVGFGPGFKMFTVKGIPFYFRYILLGGFVVLKTRDLEKTESEGKYLEDVARWKKILILLGGVGFNLAVAAVLRTLMFWFAPANTETKILAMTFHFARVSEWYLAPFYAIFLTLKMFAVYFINMMVGIWFLVLPIVRMQPIEGGGMAGMIGLGANAHAGFWSYCGLLYIVSVLLAALNLLPLMPFDGGHIATTLVQKVFGDRRVSRILCGIITYLGFAILLMLLVNMLMSDTYAGIKFFGK